jgi:MinD superfamily P-loop ATPase
VNVAVASGKGGTGKTTVAVGLALSMADADNGSPPPLLLDCDVEAPDAHLFLRPHFHRTASASVLVPTIDSNLCELCGDCVDVCRYNALAVLGSEVLVFPELCHSCGSCLHNCPTGAISETPREIGVLEAGRSNGLSFARGVLNIGEPMAVPLIAQLKEWRQSPAGGLTILDAPPGTSCPVVETLRGTDYVILVTEPTPFGLHDLELAVELVRALDLPMGVVINRDGIGDARVEPYCASEDIPVLLRIPFDRGVAEGMARGGSLPDVRPEFHELFRLLVERIET